MSDPTPIRPRRADEREYERRLRRAILDPLFGQWRSGLATAGSVRAAMARLDGLPPPDIGLIPSREVERAARRIEGYHRARLISTFRSALGVDIRPTLNDASVRRLMDAWVAENVSLIRTIPRRAHDGLHRALRRELADAPFDQSRLSALLRREYGSSGYNLRRLTRDQTSKAIGQLTQSRHRQIGIEEYIWRTVRDERVRQSHASLEGTRQRYDSPPAVGNPGDDIQCRCVAQPVIAALDDGVRYPRRTEGAQPSQGVEEFTPEKLPETGLGSSYQVETDALITALGGVDPRSSPGAERIRNYVRRRGFDDGFEHMALVDLDNGAVHAGTVHQADGVDFLGSVAATLKEAGRRIVVYHNHPRNTALSRPDIRVLGDHRGIHQIEAIASNGAVSIARLPEQLKGTAADGSFHFWTSATGQATHAVHQEYSIRVINGIMTQQMAALTHTDTVNRVLAEVGALTYTSTHHPQIEDVGFLISQTLKDLVDGIK